MSHAPTTLHVRPWSLFSWTRLCECLYRIEYTCMPVMKDAHIWRFFHNGYFQLSEEPCPTFSVFALHESKCEWHNLVVPVLTYGGQDLTPVLASEKCAIHTNHWSAMPESFNAYSKREENSMQNLNIWVLWIHIVLDLDICAWIPFL